MATKVLPGVRTYRRRGWSGLDPKFLTLGLLMMVVYFAYPFLIGDALSWLTQTFDFPMAAQAKLNWAVVPPLLIGVLSQGAILMSYVNIIRVTARYWFAIGIFSGGLLFWLPQIFNAGYTLVNP